MNKYTIFFLILLCTSTITNCAADNNNEILLKAYSCTFVFTNPVGKVKQSTVFQAGEVQFLDELGGIIKSYPYNPSEGSLGNIVHPDPNNHSNCIYIDKNTSLKDYAEYVQLDLSELDETDFKKRTQEWLEEYDAASSCTIL